MSSRHDTYGVLPENVMSGRVESFVPIEIRAPLVTSAKRARAPGPPSCETNTCLTPPRTSSHATHGTVGLAEFIVPAATRGFSASLAGVLLSEQCSSFATDIAQAPNSPPLVSRGALSWLPTATQWKPPLAPTPSLTPLA